MTTQAFAYTGAVQHWTVPPGITQIEVELWGAEGGAGGTQTTSLVPAGGKGGYVKAAITVVPGDIIDVYVPGKGQNGVIPTTVQTTSLGGFPTGSAVNQNTGYNGSAGGGGQAIVIQQSFGWRVIAGGGGGGGVVMNTNVGPNPVGGDGGFTPTDGGGDPAAPFAPSAGGGGTSAGPGGNRFYSDIASSGGTTGGTFNTYGAGGGGGNPLGNGGGARNGGLLKGGGGQGGTSWTLGSNVTVTSHATGTRSGNGAINITWGAPSHCAVFEGLVTDVVNAGNVQLSLATNSLPGSVTDYRIDFLANTTGNTTPTSGLLNSGPWTLGPMAAGTYVRYAVSRVDGAHIDGSCVMRATDTTFGLTWDVTVQCPANPWGYNLSFGQRSGL